MRIAFSFVASMFLAAALDANAAQVNAHADASKVRAEDSAAHATLDAIVPDLLKKVHVASVSVAMVVDAKTFIVGTWGEQTPGVLATPASLYNIASMSKPISAEVALRLATKGSLSLDEPMATYWTDPDIANDVRRLKLTPRLSLSHRTGFPNWRRETKGQLAFVRDPGTAFGYSGEGFEYLAKFIENKTHTPFEQLTREWVFQPLGMRDSAQSRQPWFEGRIAVPHDAEGKPLEAQFASRYLASDLIYSTAGDYATFLAGVIRHDGIDTTLATDRLRIQTDRKAELCAPPRAEHCPDEVGMGLGWEVYRFGKDHVLMHTGKDDGVFTLGYVSPERRRGVVILTNGENGAQLVLPILDALRMDRDFVAFLRDLAG